MKSKLITLLIICCLTAHAKHRSVRLAGSHLAQLEQNKEIDNLQLPRIVNDNQLHNLERDGELVRIPESYKLTVAKNITEDRRYARVWVNKFLLDFSSNFYNKFQRSVIVNSAVRTIEQQHKLRWYNRFAAPEYGPTGSSHIAGITIDIAKKKYNSKQRRWIVEYLQSMKDKGYISVANEPGCYHVCVMEKYNET